MKRVTRRELITRHKMWHAALDALVANYLLHHREKRLNTTTVMELIEWSNEQTFDPAAEWRNSR